MIKVDENTYNKLSCRIYISSLNPTLLAVDFGKPSPHLLGYKDYSTSWTIILFMWSIACSGMLLFVFASITITPAEVIAQRTFFDKNDNNKPQEYFEITYNYQEINEDGQEITITSYTRFEVQDSPEVEVGDKVLIRYSAFSEQFIELLPPDPVLIQKRVTEETIALQTGQKNVRSIFLEPGLVIWFLLILGEIHFRGRGILARKDLYIITPS